MGIRYLPTKTNLSQMAQSKKPLTKDEFFKIQEFFVGATGLRDWDYNNHWVDKKVEAVTCKVEHMDQMFDKFLDWLNTTLMNFDEGKCDLSPLEIATLAQTVFVTNHFFVKGNGNLGFEIANYVLEYCGCPCLLRNNQLDASEVTTGRFKGFILREDVDFLSMLEKNRERLRASYKYFGIE